MSEPTTTQNSSARIRVELPADGVRRLVLARPETRNAQDRQLLYELNDAFNKAATCKKLDEGSPPSR